MKRLNIALLSGGNSSERVIALKSAQQVANSLSKEKYNIFVIDINGESWNYDSTTELDRNDFSLMINDTKITFDYALIIIHGTPGEDGMVQGYLDMMKIPYSSCNMVSTVITFDKLLCKRVVAPYGVNLAREIVVNRRDSIDSKAIVEELGLPLFVKPNASGSSFGVTKVKQESELLAAIDVAMTESDTVLIEEMLEGREVGCGVLITKEKEYFLPITEIISKKEFFDYEAKYTPGNSEEITPADLSHETVAELNRQCRIIYNACRCSGIVRIDFMVSSDGTPYMIEVNSIPGMSEGSIVPQQVAAAGMTMADLWDIVIEETTLKLK